MKCTVCAREVEKEQWSRIRAYADGWFEQMDGTAYCPDHAPSWVAEWRKRKKEAK